jgi:hypothetical protein
MVTEQTADTPALAAYISLDDRCPKKPRLADLAVRAVHETIEYIFKEPGAKAIFDFLEKMYNLKLEEIVEKPEVFAAGFERLTVSAAFLMEKMILENLYSKLNLNFEVKDDYKFADYIEELRRKIDAEG